MKRREFIGLAGRLVGGATLGPAITSLESAVAEPARPADLKLKIAPHTLEIAKGISIKTTAYNDQVPGPVLRVRKGKPISIEVKNATSNADLVHWHGLATDTLNDGAMEEGSPMIAPGQTLTYHVTPNPGGTRWYHTHAMAGANLALGSYSGQFGFLLIDDGRDRGDYDREVNLAIHHWEPSLAPMVETMREMSANHPQTTGSDVVYKYATINEHMLGAGEPIRVRHGERILMRLLNASATENVILALPGHTFRITALDGNPVPNPCSVEVVSLSVAERIDAVVEMNNPGVWTLGSTNQKSRAMGLGVVVEYAGQSASPVWKDPAPSEWDYIQFGTQSKAAAPDRQFELTFRDVGPVQGSQFDTWTINNKSWPNIEPLVVKSGERCRLIFRNGSGDQHPMHLHRHTFEVTRIGDTQLSGLYKDVINVMPLDSVAVDFVANNPGDTLLHCHQQLHMDYGFMQLIKYGG
ncbi:multicopper oxidase family protein [Tunturiibacter gelidiferens]|uniref:multicopper oxidase family protein n=1 Tax=Tunturiibacter gelidiferens TaxID=3069689 RepID=UPI003D9B2BA5